MAAKAVVLPEPLRVMGGTRSDIETNIQTLSSHVTRINDGADEKPWDVARVKRFLAGTRNAELMSVLTTLGFKCGSTDQRTQETTYQHPEVKQAAIKVPFPTATIHLAATQGLIDQTALAIVQFATAQYAVWHAEPQLKPGETGRDGVEAMSKPVLAMT